MNCSVHHDLPAVAQCNECGRGLCNSCADVYDPPTCERCVSKAVSLEKASALKQIVLAGALFAFGTFVGFGLAHTPGVPPPFPPLMTGLLLGVWVAGIPTGYRTLTNLTPRVFLILPLAGWFFYFLFKFCAAWTIGAFILPFKLGTWLAELFHQNRLKIAVPLACYILLFATVIVLLKSQSSSLQPVSSAVISLQPASSHVISRLPFVDTLAGGSVGSATGIQWSHALGNSGAIFSSGDSSHIEYPDLIPAQGTLEFWIKVNDGYHYDNYRFMPNQDDAMIFSSDVQGGDVTWPGTMKIFVTRSGNVSLWMATNKYDKPPAVATEARTTAFRFGEWHALGFSYGSQGQFIMLDGKLVASDPDRTQIFGEAGNHQRPLDIPTIGETVSHFWRRHQYEGGFDGVLAAFRVSARQEDWSLASGVKSAKSPGPIANASSDDNNPDISPSSLPDYMRPVQGKLGKTEKLPTGTTLPINTSKGRSSIDVVSPSGDESGNSAAPSHGFNHSAETSISKDMIIPYEEMAKRWVAGDTPRYPAIARAMGISGTVTLLATISKTGTVADIKIISGPALLQQSAADAVKTWKYEPYLVNGRPVEVQTNIQCAFSL